MKRKFKIGDRVRIIRVDGEPCDISEYSVFIGNIGIVKDISETRSYPYTLGFISGIENNEDTGTEFEDTDWKDGEIELESFKGVDWKTYLEK